MINFKITESALNQLHKIAQSESLDLNRDLLRVAVVTGGCSGLTYDLGWDKTITESDQVIQIDDIRVVLDGRSYLYVEGTELDFTEGLEGKGFHFNNPQALRTCACGESFGV